MNHIARVLDWFDNLSVVRRVLGGFVLLVGLMILASVISGIAIATLNRNLSSVAGELVPLVDQANKVGIELLSANRHFKDVITSRQNSAMDQSEQAFAASREEFQQQLQALKTMAASYPALSDALAPLETIDDQFFDLANVTMRDYRAIVADEAKVKAAAADFQLNLPQLRRFVGAAVQELGDDYVRFMADEYLAQLSIVEKNAVLILS